MNINDIEKNIRTVKKYSAIIEEIGNTDFPGQVKIRVAGVHTPSKTKLPTDKLPWQKVENETGAGGGIGESINLAIGQWIEVEAEHEGQSSWRVLKNIPAVGKLTDDLEAAFGNVAKGYMKDWLTQDIIPRIGSTILELLETTTWKIINSGCTKCSSNGCVPCGSPPAGPPKEFTCPLQIECNGVGWCRDMEKVVDKKGKNLSTFRHAITVNGYEPNQDQVTLTLLPSTSGGPPGDIKGYDTEGNELHAKLDNWDLVIPPMVVKPNSPPHTTVPTDNNLICNQTIREIGYRITDNANGANFVDNIVRIRIVHEMTDATDTMPSGEVDEGIATPLCGARLVEAPVPAGPPPPGSGPAGQCGGPCIPTETDGSPAVPPFPPPSCGGVAAGCSAQCGSCSSTCGSSCSGCQSTCDGVMSTCGASCASCQSAVNNIRSACGLIIMASPLDDALNSAEDAAQVTVDTFNTAETVVNTAYDASSAAVEAAYGDPGAIVDALEDFSPASLVDPIEDIGQEVQNVITDSGAAVNDAVDSVSDTLQGITDGIDAIEAALGTPNAVEQAAIDDARAEVAKVAADNDAAKAANDNANDNTVIVQEAENKKVQLKASAGACKPPMVMWTAPQVLGQFILEEELSTADKSKPDECKVWQSPRNWITERKDYTEGNQTWEMAHTYKVDDPETISRMVMGPTGTMTLKSAQSMNVFNKLNYQHMTENNHETFAKKKMAIWTPTYEAEITERTTWNSGDFEATMKGRTTWISKSYELVSQKIAIHTDMLSINGDTVHFGNVCIEGNLKVSGKITAGVDVVTNGISLKTHKHTGVKTGTSVSGLPI